MEEKLIVTILDWLAKENYPIIGVIGSLIWFNIWFISRRITRTFNELLEIIKNNMEAIENIKKENVQTIELIHKELNGKLHDMQKEVDEKFVNIGNKVSKNTKIITDLENFVLPNAIRETSTKFDTIDEKLVNMNTAIGVFNLEEKSFREKLNELEVKLAKVSVSERRTP